MLCFNDLILYLVYRGLLSIPLYVPSTYVFRLAPDYFEYLGFR